MWQSLFGSMQLSEMRWLYNSGDRRQTAGYRRSRRALAAGGVSCANAHGGVHGYDLYEGTSMAAPHVELLRS